MAVEVTRNDQMFGDVGSRVTFFLKMRGIIIYFMLMEMIQQRGGN